MSIACGRLQEPTSSLYTQRLHPPRSQAVNTHEIDMGSDIGLSTKEATGIGLPPPEGRNFDCYLHNNHVLNLLPVTVHPHTSRPC